MLEDNTVSNRPSKKSALVAQNWRVEHASLLLPFNIIKSGLVNTSKNMLLLATLLICFPRHLKEAVFQAIRMPST
jgi:hypothetical protein